ncbi:hypothetical protein RHSIM_Rhsim10G0100100 [Rhododendron simsii]|uniref:CRESS-DNA virus Rep endonuclease domain-containing protein n=1 Tax=Rhododendron simsii TaxID=118357 RepID=A0A834GBJ3_RHOSS|nr:hypothetical protein RHSIM_Rhsim10G0100100 [Rhododendron simsii]
MCKELHEDGEPHLHVLLQLEGRYQLTNPRFFDLVSPNKSAHFHCNIQAASSSSDVKSYIEKGGEYIDWGEFQIDGRSAKGGQQSINAVYADALNASSKHDALQIIKEKDPKSFIFQFHNINANLDKIFCPPPKPYVNPFNPSSFNKKSDMQEWVNINVKDSAARPNRPISIIIEGPSRIGKTHWKEFIGAQKDWQSNCKYGKPVQIKGGIPTIVLCNLGVGSSFYDYLNKEDHGALKAWTTQNATFIFLDETPLYTTTEVSTEPEANSQSIQDQTMEN